MTTALRRAGVVALERMATQQDTFGETADLLQTVIRMQVFSDTVGTCDGLARQASNT